MKKFLIAASLAASVALGGCASMGGGGSINDPDFVQKLISRVADQCPFALSVGSAAQLIATVSGQGSIALTVSMINQLAVEVCAAITPKPSALRGAGPPSAPVVRGVTIVGTPTR